MIGAFETLGGFLLLVSALAIALLLFAAVTDFRKMDKTVLWGIFWACLITGAILVILSDIVLPKILAGQ